MKKSFTLIELLIVLIIIGILTTLAIPKYLDYVEKMRAAEAINTIYALRNAEQGYWAESGTYTTDIMKLNLENIPTNDIDASNRGRYWYYELDSFAVDVPTPGGDPYDHTMVVALDIIAHRSTKSNGNITHYIELLYNTYNGGRWYGTHPGKPKNN